MRLYFIGIASSDSVNTEVNQFKQYMLEHFHCKAAMKSPAHITLVPPFYLDPSEEEKLFIEIESIANDHTQFQIDLENFAAFAPRVIYVNVKESPELEQLYDSIHNQLIAAGFNIKKDERKFTPHVTVATRDLSKYDFPAAFRHFQQIQYANSFAATGITVFRNSPGRWDILHDVPFRGDPLKS